MGVLFVVGSPMKPPPAPTPAPTPAPMPTPAPAPTPVGPCVTPNILYDSHKDGNTLLDGQAQQVSDSTGCQELCYETDGCVCFSHRKSLGHCWLMTECKSPEDNNLDDSGTATCALEV